MYVWNNSRLLKISNMSLTIVTICSRMKRKKLSRKLICFRTIYRLHLVRGKYQGRKFEEDTGELSGDSTVVVADYMKLLFQKLFEPQKNWFGKKGVSLHGTMFLYKSEGKLITEFYDLYCENDDKQNCFFSASCVEESFKNFRQLHPHIVKAKLGTDNGPHYKNTSFVFWVPKLT